MKIKKNKIISILTIVLCICLMAGCGNAAVPANEPPEATESDTTADVTEAEVKEADDTANVTEAAKITEAVKEEAKEAESTDEAKVTAPSPYKSSPFSMMILLFML